MLIPVKTDNAIKTPLTKRKITPVRKSKRLSLIRRYKNNNLIPTVEAKKLTKVKSLALKSHLQKGFLYEGFAIKNLILHPKKANGDFSRFI